MCGEEGGVTVIRFPRSGDPVLTYRQLSEELGVSVRFLKERHAEGMEDEGLDYGGRRRFRLSKATAFLDERNKAMGR